MLFSASVLFVSLARIVATKSLASRPAVSLLFQNDGNWTNYASVPSALLFHEPTTYDEAKAICKANNETLLPEASLKTMRNQFAYLEYLKDISRNTRFWVSTSGERTNACSAPLVSVETSLFGHSSEKLPFLCTNSAPHTTKVDTDFSSSPRSVVTSKGGNIYWVSESALRTRDHLTFRFMGIPYAQPPVGPLRFRDPQPWNGTEVDATFFKPICLQFGFFGSNDFGLMPWGNSEDCLTLHVFTPYLPANPASKSSPALKPVLFWIHGGGNTQGTGEDATFDGGPLVSRTDSVVVTIDHRLNIFGYLGIDETISGNYAIADKIAALQWVKENIAQFGGDPERVMIFGQSAGGWSVIELVKSPKAKGLFSAAISQSGGSGSAQSLEAAAATVVPFLDVYCNSTGAERLACLQALPAETLLNITNNATTWVATIDGVYTINDTISQVSAGPSGINSVAYMAGFMPEEGQSLLGTSIAPNLTTFDPAGVVGNQTLGDAILASGLWNISTELTPYNATINVFTDYLLTCPAESMITAAAKASAFPALYVYEMQRGYALSYYDPYNLCTFPVGEEEPPYYRCHSGDLYEVFGTYHIFDQPVRNARDIAYTTMVQDMWSSFARTGNPNPSKAYLKARGYTSTLNALSGWTWEEYSEEQPKVAQLQYPGISTGLGLPDTARCRIIV
ncbi:alpha/beta-hydrolase [Mycena amicta]|nr:alpha/beta-hydrolase [Mycena amicta]